MATRKRAKKTTEKPKFPATIYVTNEGDGEDQYLGTWYSPEDVTEAQEIAVYELVRVGKLVITKEVK